MPYDKDGKEKKLSISVVLREGYDVILDINNRPIDEAIQSIDDKLRFGQNVDLKEKIDNVRRKPRL